jgi:hypothetical protein
MERLKYPERLSRQQEFFGQRRIKRWLGRLVGLAKSDPKGGRGAVSSHTGNLGEPGGGAQPTAASPQFGSMARQAVKNAIIDYNTDAENEPGSPVGRLFPSFVASPARSQDPRLASLDWRLLASPDSMDYKRAIVDPNPPSMDSLKSQMALLLINYFAPRRDDT